MVFLNADKLDERHVRKVEKIMIRNEVSCALSMWELDEKSMLEDMEHFILNSDGVIVFYGNVNALWVRKRLHYCRNLIFRREEPLKALAVYEGPPRDKMDYNFTIPGLKTINCRDCFDEEKLRPFLEAIGKGGWS